jgi:hypothetical protein
MSWDTAAAEKKQKDVIASVEKTMSTLTLDDIQSQGLTLRIGGKVVKFEMTGETSLPEDEIRKEYAQKLTEKLKSIKDSLNEKMSEMAYMADEARRDFEKKERALNDKLKMAKPMPDITFEHAKSGLSVVKGTNMGELFWMYQGIYWPKFVDNRPISPTYIKKMITPITLTIATKDNKVTSVTVRKTIGLGKFDHYHNTGSGDCWGSWSFEKSWSTPNDILGICKDAMAVLENINGNSLANRTPAGLPTYAAVRKNSTETSSGSTTTLLNKVDERIGVTEDTERDTLTGGSWTT